MCGFLCGCKFQLLWVNTKECIAGSGSKSMFGFIKKTTKLSSDLTVPVSLTMDKGCYSSKSLPAFTVVSLVFFLKRSLDGFCKVGG